jgi:glucose-6-phosphate isomerase
MAYEALKHFSDRDMTFRFVSNVDGTDFAEAVIDLDAAETMFIISSKTFTTLETMTNAQTARDWSARPVGGDETASPNTSSPCRPTPRAYPSSASTPPTCSASGIGSAGATPWTPPSGSPPWSPSARDNFQTDARRLPRDGRALPHHVLRAEPAGADGASGTVWYNDFFGAQTVAVLPYEQYLKRFPAYLQQLTMESNGKHVHLSASTVEHSPAPSTGANPAPTASTRSTSSSIKARG